MCRMLIAEQIDIPCCSCLILGDQSVFFVLSFLTVEMKMCISLKIPHKDVKSFLFTLVFSISEAQTIHKIISMMQNE